MTGTYPKANGADPYITVDVTIAELDAFVKWAEPTWRQLEDGPLKAFMELMLDCSSNNQISGETEFRLGPPSRELVQWAAAQKEATDAEHG